MCDIAFFKVHKNLAKNHFYADFCNVVRTVVSAALKSSCVVVMVDVVGLDWLFAI
jgi:hypothetical protein